MYSNSAHFASRSEPDIDEQLDLFKERLKTHDHTFGLGHSLAVDIPEAI